MSLADLPVLQTAGCSEIALFYFVVIIIYIFVSTNCYVFENVCFEIIVYYLIVAFVLFVGGDLSLKNIWLAESVLDIFTENRQVFYFPPKIWHIAKS